MHNTQAHGQHFLRNKEMANIGTAVSAANGAVALRVNRIHVLCIFCILQIDCPFPGKEPGMPGISGRHYTVEEVHTSGNSLNNIAGGSHTHQITRLLFRHIGFHCFDHIVHFFCRLTHSKTANGIARKIQICNAFHMINADIVIDAALINTPKHLLRIYSIRKTVQPRIFFLASNKPSIGSVYAFQNIVSGSRIFNTFIKSHTNIRTQIRLDLHALLRAHKDFPSINMRSKIHALFLNFPQRGQAEYLESTGVRKDWAIPSHKLMQTAALLHQCIARTQMQMISIGQFHLAANIFQIFGTKRTLNGTLGADIHKNRSLHCTMGASKLTTSGSALCFQQFKHNNLTLYQPIYIASPNEKKR